MSKKARKKPKYFNALDFFIVVFFLSIAAMSINLFRLDLLNTINLQNVQPVGFVVIKKNIVQRRHSDRVLWDRLANESPVYTGNLIRVADVSSATLDIQQNNIDLEENTLIRIIVSPDGDGVRIILNEGTLSLASKNESKKINVEVNGRQVRPDPGTVLKATARQDGRVSVQVNQGRAQFVETGRAEREISTGSLISMNANGTELAERAVVVTMPVPNARYLKTTTGLFTVFFNWNRINLAPNETLRLEISADRDFSRIYTRVDNLDRQAQVQLDSGLWYWRLSFQNTVLSDGSLTVSASTVPQLTTPSTGSVYNFTEEQPLVNFQWAEVEGAVAYIFQVSALPDFVTPRIDIQTTAVSFSDSSLGEGKWYWRVMPVFPSVFSGRTDYSPVTSFNIEKSPQAPAVQEVSLSQWLAEQANVPVERSPERPQEPAPQVTTTEQPRVQPAASQPAASQPAASQPVTLLPAPQNLRPVNRTVFDFEGLRSQRSIPFSWSAVNEANAYIFTLYQQGTSGRRQIIRTTISGDTRYVLENLRLLDKGTFVWQVEAVTMGRGNNIERRGRVAEAVFVLDFDSPLPVQIEDTGVLYGN